MSFLSKRRRTGLSQQAVATRIGVNQSAVCLWENGKTLPCASILPKLASLYNCTVDELLREDEPAVGKETE